ncbi:MAG: rhombotarget lipoprotein [Methylococcales bacterium]
MFDRNDNSCVLKSRVMSSTVLNFAFFVSFSLVSLSGCSGTNFIQSSSSVPLAEVISEVKDSRQVVEKKPLKLPTSVGIVFVHGTGYQHLPDTALHMAADKLKEQLLANPKFVRSVFVVANDDIKTKVSLLDRIKTLYGVEVIVLVSYQQDQRTLQSGMGRLADLTVFGSFLIPAVEIKTETIIDGKVIHIADNSLIFKASGADGRSESSTSYSLDGVVIEESIKGLLAATTNFGNSLSQTISRYQTYDPSHAVSASPDRK